MNVLLVGGSSDIGLAIVRRLARSQPVRPFLLGRNRDLLAAAVTALEQTGCANGEFAVLDTDDELEAASRAVADAFHKLEVVDLVIVAVGVLGAQAGLDAPAAEAAEVMRVNFVGAGTLLLECLRHLHAQGRGTAVVLSSVAGVRVRASNAIYGASKAGLDGLAQGIGDALAGSGVRVVVVRPGFVLSKMTAGLKPPPFSVTPEAVADATVRALNGRAETVWVPGRMRIVFAILGALPRTLWRKVPF
jgi:decaprenylphospho-beta-D-erythro-pentofuranosid-2-ulose 2-reductase